MPHAPCDGLRDGASASPGRWQKPLRYLISAAASLDKPPAVSRQHVSDSIVVAFVALSDRLGIFLDVERRQRIGSPLITQYRNPDAFP